MGFEQIHFMLGQLSCRMVTLSAQYRFTKSYNRHRHAFLEFHYVTKGSCCFCVGESNYTVDAQMLLCIGAGTYHSVKQVSADLSKMSFGLELEFPTEQRCEGSDQMLRLQHFQAVLLQGSGFEAVLQTLRRAQESAFDAFLFREELKAQMALLVLHLARNIPEAHRQALSHEAAETRYAQSIEEFFNLNHSLKNGKAALADHLCISSRQLNRVLHTLYAMSYREKLNEIRLEIARDLLQTTQKSMEEIAEILGYGNGSNFTSFIKKSTGKTPSQLRRERQIPAR